MWCIPGTFIFNLLGGALFGIKLGFFMCVLMNSLGGFSCYMLSKIFCSDLVHTKLKEKLEGLSKTVRTFTLIRGRWMSIRTICSSI